MYVNKGKWDAPPTSGTIKNGNRKTSRKAGGNSGKTNWQHGNKFWTLIELIGKSPFGI